MEWGPESLESMPLAPGVGFAPSQVLRKAIIALLILVAANFLFIASPYWTNGGLAREGIQWIGILLIVICILGRTWCTLYIGGRKHVVLVKNGPYSLTRNPLYTSSIIGAVGVGAQFGSVIVALASGLFVWMIFLWTVMREEAALTAAFQDDYRSYLASVPRFLPKPALWQSPATIVVHSRVAARTFLDSLVFFLPIPLMEVFQYLHDAGILQVYLTVP